MYKSEIDGIHENTIIESWNARFFKHIYPLKTSTESIVQKRARDPETSEDNVGKSTYESNVEPKLEGPRSSKRQGPLKPLDLISMHIW